MVGAESDIEEISGEIDGGIGVSETEGLGIGNCLWDWSWSNEIWDGKQCNSAIQNPNF